MRTSLYSRAIGGALILIGAACSPADRDLAASDTLSSGDSAAGVVDTVPATTATTVAAILSDENVFALLDTALASVLQTSTLAQSKASNKTVKELASATITDLALTRRAISSTAERLNVSPALPDRDILRQQRDALAGLEGKNGADFDRAYLDYEVAVRKELIDEIDDALDGEVRRAEVRTLLQQARASLESGRAEAEQLRSRL